MYAINGEVKNLTKLESVQSTQLCGKSCLAGDIFGEYDLQGQTLSIGDRVSFGNAAGYTMVKKTGLMAWICQRLWSKNWTARLRS